MNEIAFQFRNMLQKTGLKVGCFAGFCYHRLMTMSVHMHVCVLLYFVFESGMKIGLRTITSCRKDGVLFNKHK